MTWRTIPLCVLGATLSACGGPQLTLTEQNVQENLNWLGRSIALCEPDAIPGERQRTFDDLARVIQATEAAEARRTRQADGSWRYEGSCGGGVGYQSDHGGGITTWDVDFENYCTRSADGDANLVRGGMRGREIGQSTPNGPMIRAFEFGADMGIDWRVPNDTLAQQLPWSRPGGSAPPWGEVGEGVGDLVTAEGQTRFRIEGLRTDYGRPDTWSPGEPTPDAPDRTRVQRISVENTATQERLELRNLAWDTFVDGGVQVHIDEGRLILPGGEWVEIRTSADEPLRLSLTSRVHLKGAGGTTADLFGDIIAGFFSADVNGTPMAAGIDCADADQTLAETLSVILATVPPLAR